MPNTPLCRRDMLLHAIAAFEEGHGRLPTDRELWRICSVLIAKTTDSAFHEYRARSPFRSDVIHPSFGVDIGVLIKEQKLVVEDGRILAPTDRGYTIARTQSPADSSAHLFLLREIAKKMG